jgi:protein-S-isoprenylcysteine O-methyltransferase Ste14
MPQMIDSTSAQLSSSPGWRRALAPVGRFFFKFRDFLFPVVFLGLALASRPAGGRYDRVLDAAGILVALSGQLLRAVVIGFAYIRRGGKNKQVYADSLVQEGVFAHSRNPLYLGNFLALVGFCLVHDSALCYLVGIPFFAFAYLAITAAEEEYLQGKFGAEYDAYCRRVPRYLPSFAGLGATLEGMSFDWPRLLRKEYGSTFAGLSLILALLVWDEYLLRGPAAEQAMLPGVLSLWAVLVCAYLTVLVLKKRGALGRG